MGVATLRNAVDVDRILSFGITHHASILDNVINNLRAAVSLRAGRGLDAFIVTAPDLTKLWLLETQTVGPNKTKATSCRGVSMDVATANKFFNTGASVTFFPPFDEQLLHYTLAPASAMPPFLRNLVGPWTDEEVEVAAANPHGWEFLFFHEYPVHGGDLDMSTIPPTPRTFFLQALGDPKPMAQKKTQLPP